ncbi:hypothetical protein DM01DRAFT_1348288 [Hesseltinella vesiculosa]|uniref:Ataxin-10 homolog n=1 Tax=Hesseltinella vesiculosa TaxID=101127 RepID=A0A1X2G948_9FUNG|nr:hypothetical protein DM01DRAFT_1348288 [Hesseltinella vesiculosa]
MASLPRGYLRSKVIAQSSVMSRTILSLDALAHGSLADQQAADLLNEAIQQSVQDQQFRIDFGQQPKLWSSAHKLLSDQAKTQHDWVIPLIKLLRNAAAANPVAQQLACDAKVIIDLVDLIRLSVDSMEEYHVMVVRLATQAVCNMITGNESVLQQVWSLWCETDTKSIWTRVVETIDKDAITAVLILLYQSIRNSASRCELLVKTTNGLSILKAVLLEGERYLDDETNKHFELTYLMMSELLTHGFFVEMLDRLRTSEWTNQSQTMVIKILDLSLYKGNAAAIPWTSLEVNAICDLLCTLCDQATQVMEHALDNNQDQVSKLDLDQAHLMHTCLVLILQTLNWALTNDGHFQQNIRSAWRQRHGMQRIIELLRQSDKMVEWKDKDEAKRGFGFVKRELVQSIGNLCYKDKAFQNEVRELGGLGLILNQMQIDDTNPFMREYATVALRHVLEDNSENQDAISSMTPIGTSQPEELSKMGIQATLEDGKIKWAKFK